MAEEKQHKVMTQPLPSILDELEAGLAELRELIARTEKAAAIAEEAAEEARRAGVGAGEQARKAAEVAVGKIGIKVDETTAYLTKLIDAVREVALESLKLGQDLKAALVKMVNTGADELNKIK